MLASGWRPERRLAKPSLAWSRAPDPAFGAVPGVSGFVAVKEHRTTGARAHQAICSAPIAGVRFARTSCGMVALGLSACGRGGGWSLASRGGGLGQWALIAAASDEGVAARAMTVCRVAAA